MSRHHSVAQASALAHAFLFVAAFAAFSAGAGELVVSPDGLAPHEALAKIRAAKAAGDRSAWTVRVKAGEYQFAEPLVFTPEDSGETGAPVRWIGEYGAVFSGGRRIGGWRDAGGGVWEYYCFLKPTAIFQSLKNSNKPPSNSRLQRLHHLLFHCLKLLL